MKVNTKYFGKIDFEEHEIIDFSDGVFGFEQCKKFIVIRFDNDSDSFLCLQSIEDKDTAFVIANPFYIDPMYNVQLPEEELKSLSATKDTPLLIYTITVMRENFVESTVNLRCPIVVNPKERIAKQVILDTAEYSMRHPIVVQKKEE